MTEIPNGYGEVIRSRDEETDCQQCGFPLYRGDTIYWHDDGPYCCSAHAKDSTQGSTFA